MTSDLIYVGLNGAVTALDKATGVAVWVTSLKGAGFVNVIVEDDFVFASSRGEVYCLDARTGAVRWQNPFKGYGFGIATMATQRNPGGTGVVAMEEIQRRDRQANAAAASSGGSH
jgi:outer membrane protein assembly factor BamB